MEELKNHPKGFEYVLQNIEDGLALLSEISWNETFAKIKNKCKEIEDSEDNDSDDIVYKKITNVYHSWIIIMKKIPKTKLSEGTITNEEREGIKDKTRAKFRANKLKVIGIINIENPSEKESKIIGSYNKLCTIYEIGRNVYPDSFNYNLDIVCTNGIHYFKSLEPALFYDVAPSKYTGFFTNWYNSGEKSGEGPMLNGKRHGYWKFFWDDGRKKSMGHFVNGNENGIWLFFDHSAYKTVSLYEHGRKCGDIRSNPDKEKCHSKKRL